MEAHLYIPRSPPQSRLTSQKNIQGLSTTQLTVEYIVQEWVQEAGEAFQEHRDQKGHELVDRIARLCAEETARAYNLLLLDKMQSYWDRARAKAGRKGRKLPASLSRLQQAREDVAADRSRIVTARTIWEIYNEAWPVYAAAVPDDDADMWMPAELPAG
ncbi:hypothetical protein X797_012154 [Metarhizium robertsii]|uniref:Uncharacterized protein n=1 Tax=Metarhizium robertsii TaxID=568076 RepID=A0A014N515_9HYPO|nr:hypothetical protein X797_012154 [Metarhizium robertsii]